MRVRQRLIGAVLGACAVVTLAGCADATQQSQVPGIGERAGIALPDDAVLEQVAYSGDSFHMDGVVIYRITVDAPKPGSVLDPALFDHAAGAREARLTEMAAVAEDDVSSIHPTMCRETIKNPEYRLGYSLTICEEGSETTFVAFEEQG